MVHTVKLFGKSSGLYLNMVQAFTGCGKLLAPLLAWPFLAEQDILLEFEQLILSENKTWNIPRNLTQCNCFEGVCYGTNCTHKYTKKYLEDYEFGANIHIPFTVVAMVLCLAGIACFCAYFFFKPTNLATQEDDLKEKSRAYLTFVADLCTCERFYEICILILLFLFYVFIVVCINGGEYYLYPLLMVSDLKITKTEATWLNTAFHACLVISRLITMGILCFISIKIFMNIMLLAACVVCILWTFIGLNSKLNMWILSPLYMFIFAPVYSSGLAYADRYVEVTGLITALLDLGAGAAITSSTWLLPWLLHHFGPQYVLLSFLCCTIICFCFSCAIYVIGKLIVGDRYETYKTVEEDDRHPLFQDSNTK